MAMLLVLVLLQGVLLVSSAEIGVKIVNRSPEVCTTLSGHLCVFPFTYQGVTYEKCTYARSERPWCATEVNRDNVVITNKWDDCNLHSETSCPVEKKTEAQDIPQCWTVGGPSPDSPCVFPFTHNGVRHTECTTEGLGQPWCSIATYYNGTHISGKGLYGLCPPSCPGVQESRRCRVTEGPARGQHCDFPFIWAGRTHQSCATWTYGGPHQGKPWCSTRTDQSGNHLNGQGNFGFCSSDCADNNNNNNNNNLGQRINLVEAPEDNNDAVVFANDEDAGVILPPS